jgi:DNA-binding NarL/FixJ family response regulator
MSLKTVDHRVQALFRKFGVHSRGELAAEALRRRIVRLGRARHSG